MRVVPNAQTSLIEKRRSRDGLKLACGMLVLFTLGSVARYRGNSDDQQVAMLDHVAAAPSFVKSNYSSVEDAEWEEFTLRFSKSYESEEEQRRRRGYFHDRMAQLRELNDANGEEVFGATTHADRAPDEIVFGRGRRGRGHVPDVVNVKEFGKTSGTDAVDWRLEEGVVTPVKNQGQCGSCWAFSAAEQMESQLVLAGGPSVALSPQQIASCTPQAYGCGGGDPILAYEYVASSVGLSPMSYWPYIESMVPSGTCVEKECTAACDKNIDLLQQDFEFIGPYASLQGFAFAVPPCLPDTNCTNQNLEALADVVALTPVSICVNAENWDDYVSGVMTAQVCGGSTFDDLDHCVQLVGYNRTAEKPYWLVRNSWSTLWGEEGYARLQFDANTCGIANEATIVDVRVGAS